MSSLPSFTGYFASILILALGACAPSQIKNEIVPAGTSTLQLPTPTVSVTSVPDLLGTSEFVVSTPTVQLPTPSPIFTHVPTLPADEAYTLLANWLQNNNDCQLPCWGGLIPGKSPSLEAYSKLTAFSSITDDFNYFHPSGGVVFITYPSDGLQIDIGVHVYSKFDNRRTIQVAWISTYTLRQVTGGYEEVYNAPVSNELLGAYLLKSILSKYGPPTEVLVRADIYNTGTQETFSITLLYPEKGIFVRYNMLAERLGDQIRGCPSHSFVDLWLLSPEDAGVYQDILLSNDLHWEGEWSYTTPIQEAASMSVEDFYKLFIEPTDVCLETPLSIWPEH